MVTGTGVILFPHNQVSGFAATVLHYLGATRVKVATSARGACLTLALVMGDTQLCQPL
ncbi:hypothetical protein GPB2148_470 [marine gamma proteobacterium HTCC2148]|nr:hypothetical protein GPB2148_470 [marine gamma proteobacterium HTCC2148]